MKTKNLLIFSLTAASLLAFACQKETSHSTLRIRMTDAPAAYNEVNVDLQQVQVKMASDTSNWVMMDTRSGIYNLLDLQNGIDTLIAQGALPPGVVKEIRLVLGSRNSIKEGDQSYGLTIPSGSESGLKIKVDKALNASVDSLLVDFDAALSVKKQSDSFKLMPVLRIKK